ncbi:Polygalacturonase ADPG2, partial [Mucuna pruriens]
MQRLFTCILVLGFVLPTLCLSNDGENETVNVMDYGAHGDGKSDDSNAFLSAWQHLCGGEGPATMLIPSGKIFLVTRLELNGPCKAPSVGIK